MNKRAAVALVLIVSMVFVLGACSGGAAGSDATAFYKSNAVTLTSSGSLGGATQLGGQYFAEFWQQVTGGSMKVENKQGAGGREGLYIVHDAKPDGLTLGISHVPTDITGAAITGVAAVTFDVREFSYLGIFGASPNATFQRIDSPYKTIDDLKKAKDLRFGATNAGAPSHMIFALAKESLGLDGKIVAGFATNEFGLAAKRGELELYSMGIPAGLDQVKAGQSKLIWVNTFERSAWAPETPAFAQVAKLNSDQQTIMKMIESQGAAKTIYTSGKVPADRIEFLRRTFDKIMAMPAFQEKCKPTFGIWEPPVKGEQVTKDINDLYSLPPAQAKLLQDMLKRNPV